MTQAYSPWGAKPLEPRHYANDNNVPQVVALTGPAGCGKSTAASHFTGRGFTLVKFAGPLKDAMRAIGLSEEHIEGNVKERPCSILQGKTPRHAMQTLGTEWGRKCIGEHFWVGLWERRVLEVIDEGGRVVVDDCRFPNEADAVRKLGGIVIQLVGRGGISGEHESERMEFEPDIVLANAGSVDELKQSVTRLVA